MDKYEYKLKTEQMLELMEDGAYNKAAEIADTIDWKRVRNATMLTNVSDIYEKNRDYQKSYDVLNIAYHRAEGSRKILYRLCTLALKTRNVDEAIDYYDDFIQIAPKDPNQHILRYQILRAQRSPIEQQIEALEEFKKAEYIEEWAYELAKLYQEAGMTAECLEECDDLILWFSEGKFVYQAMELKMQYKPLTPSQQEKYDHRYERLSSETEEMPDLSMYKKEAEPSAEQVEEELQEKIAQTEEKIQEMSQPEPKRKLGNTMKLDEALKSLLHLDLNLEGKSADGDSSDDPVRVQPADEEEDLHELEGAIEEIESVADLNLVRELKAEKQAKLDPDLEELIPGPEEDVDTVELVEEDAGEVEAAGMELVEEVEEELPDDEAELVEEEGEELLADDAEFVEDVEEELPEDEAELALAEEAGEELPADDAELVEEAEKELPAEDVEREQPLAADETEILAEAKENPVTGNSERSVDSDQIEGQMSFGDLLGGWTVQPEESETTAGENEAGEAAEPEMELKQEEENGEQETDEDSESVEELESLISETDNTGVIQAEESTEMTVEELVGQIAGEFVDAPEKEGAMEEKKKKAEPILPPDIQRLIDEIEGVIPPEEEERPVSRTLERRSVKAEVRENMGAVTDQLRVDETSELFEDYDDVLDEDDYEAYEEDLAEEFEDDLEEYAEEELTDDFDWDAAEEYEEAGADEYEETAEAYEDYDEPEAEEYEEADIDDYEEYEEADAEEYEEADAEEYDESYEDEYEDTYEAEEYEDVEADEYEDDAEAIGESLREEFRPRAYEEDLDDWEIPDEEEEGINLLSKTTPLSRKETAKLIATGKTAPLPLDEISDALSMSDTGFIVHQRYDFQTQNGSGTRASLTEEQKKLFSYFVPVRGMSEQLVDVLEQDKNCTNRKGSSRTGNLLIIGNKGNGKTVLAVDVVKAIQKQRNIRQGKVAIVTGESLNKKKISDIFSKLYGGALIIEKAGKMNEKTISRLNKAMERDTGELLIVLEDQRKPLDRLLSSNREFRRKFTSRLEVPIFINDELVTFGQTYAQENGYRIDEMGILALYSRIDALQREDHAVTVAEVKELMDEAMTHSQKASAKKLVRRVFGKNTDDADRIILTEKDFNI